MTGKVRVMTAVYKNIKLSAREARKVRGFFADLDKEDSHLHNHTVEGVDIYRYPKIQYKVLGGKPVIVAIEEGIRSIHLHLMEERELQIGDKSYADVALDIKLSEFPVGDSHQIREYQFLTPWLALNQENIIRYYKADEEEQRELLNKILIGNILSLCKGLGVTVEKQLQVSHQLKSTSVLYKGKKMEAFRGSFQVNACIPELCGLGKGTSRGFGVVKLKKEREEEKA